MRNRSLVAAITLIAMVGCGSKPQPQGQGDAASAPTDSNAPSKARSSTTDDVLALQNPTIEADLDDPTDDGWQSEAFNVEATKQLKRLGKLLVTDVADVGLASNAIAVDSFSSDHLVPRDLALVFDDGVMAVKRPVIASGPQAKQPLMSVDAAIVEIRGSIDGTVDRNFKFKPFHVEINSDEIVTRQYFHITGKTSTHRVEQNATWLVGWTTEPVPRIRWIRLEQFEQSTIRNGNLPLFSDCTSSLLQRNPSYGDYLLQGISHWRERLESLNGVYNFGHHGIAIGDVNGDLLDDIYVCQTGGIPNHLFVQETDGTLRDISHPSGVDFLDNSRSALFIDLDNDGDQDAVISLATGLLFMENDGNANFTSRARIPSVRQAFSLASADYDNDGLLDVYVCVYYGDESTVAELPLPLPYFDAKNGGENFLIRNEGNWRFSDVTEAVGLGIDNTRFSFAATWEDDDNDGDMDLIVVNDSGPNKLYRNNRGIFTNVAEECGLRDGAFGMGATYADFDHDGRMDLYVSNMFSAAGSRVTNQPRFKAGLDATQKSKFRYLARGNSLFRNAATNRFEDVSVKQGVTMGRWSWSSLFADVNNDGWEDILVANGYVTGKSSVDL